MSDQTDAEEKLNFVMGIFLNSLDLTRTIASLINCKKVPNTVMENYAISLFNRIYTISESIRKLLPLENNDRDIFLHCSSIISLSRNLVDTSIILFYLYFDVDDPNTKRLRYAYTSLYGLKKEFDTFNMIEHDEKASIFLSKFKTSKKLLFSDQELDLSNDEKEEIKKYLSSGYQFYGYCKKEELYKNMGYIDISTLKLAQFIFSSFVHSSPSSICSKNDSLQEQHEWIVQNISFALTIGSSILLHSSMDFINHMMKKHIFIYSQFSEEEKVGLKEIILQIKSLIKIIKPEEEWSYKKLKRKAEELWT